MSDDPQRPFRVLLVDDDRAFLETARAAFEGFSKGSWTILTTPDAGSVAALLKSDPVDLIVLDARMPEISGLQLMGILQREHGAIPKVFLSGLADEGERVAALEGGAELFLEKPSELAGLQSIYATLDELMRWRRRQKSGSEPSRADVLDLVKLECKANNSRVFEIRSAEAQGLVFVKEGAIIHAECPGRRGQSAFSFLCTRPDAEFSLRQYFEPSERSIIRQWEFLYLEAVQLREQLLQAAAEAKARESAGTPAAAPIEPAATPSTPSAPPPAPSQTSPAPVTPVSAPVLPVAAADVSGRVGQEEVAQVFARRRPGSAAPALAPTPPPPPTPAEPPAPTAPPAPPPEVRRRPPSPEPLPQLRMVSTGPVAEERQVQPPGGSSGGAGVALVLPVLEMLVCTNAHEALYDWQCDDVEARLRFVEVARERAERISQHLPVGGMDRIELQSAEGRMVVQFQEDGSVFMRSGSGVVPGEPKGSVFHQSMAGWLARHAGIRGLLATGVIRPQQSSLSQSVSPDFPKEPLSVAWRCVQDVFEAAAGFKPWQLRWVYEKAQLYVTRRSDGKALAMFLTRDPERLDAAAIERVFGDFKILEAV